MNTNLNFAGVYIDDWPNYYWYCFDSRDYSVWKKEKISLFHDFHYDEVSAEEKKADGVPLPFWRLFWSPYVPLSCIVRAS